MASEWLLKEDGYLNVDCKSRKIIYHPNLNVILIFDENFLKVLDVNSGIQLFTSSVAEGKKIVRGKYLSEQDKILLWDDEKLGLRGDYNGVLLLDTILQTPTSQTDDLVKIELLMSEAVLFLQSLQSLEQQGVESSSDVINELTLKINEAHQKAKKGIKAQKWETVCLELPHSSLKVVASSMVIELKRLQRHIPALAIASAVNERLTDLIVGARIIENENTQRFHMFSEAARRKTFDQWPHMDYKWALPDQMAQAGFYHQPSDSGDDRAMCFTCNVCLVCWEKTDEPWSEHERHSPDCPFVKGEYTQNVPLSITYASNPAVFIEDFSIMSSGDQGSIICVGSPSSGDIRIWNVERQLKNSATINIKSAEKEVMKKFDVENEIGIGLSALSIFKKHTILSKGATVSKNPKTGMEHKFSEVVGTRIIAGVNVDFMPESAADSPKENNLALILFAVTEVAKTAAKSTVVVANGNSASPSVIHTKDSLSSLIANSKKTSLSTIEERFEDDFLKFFDNDNYSLPFKLPKKKEDMATGSKMMLDNGFTEIDAKSTSSSGTATPKPTKEENDVICTPIQTLSIIPCFSNHKIVEILPSYDNRHLLVVLKKVTDLVSSTNEDIVMHSNAQNDLNGSKNVQLILFAIEDNGFINEIPVNSRVLEENDTPVEIVILPKLDNNGRMFNGSPTDSEQGVFVITCIDGSIKILSLTSLKTLTETRVEDQKFISTVYCKNLERLCGCTENGSLHFYSFFDLEVDSSDESVDEETVSNDIEVSNDTASRSKKQKTANDCYVQFDNATPSTSTSFMKNNVDEKRNVVPEVIAYQKTLTLNDLKTLYSLTLFDEMLTPYSAEVPGCWSELVQAQKQRRHPQNTMRPGDDTHLTRTWRLHNDASTWDEHLIELSLPKTTSLGHIDFKFSLYQPCSSPPAIQVTLLKQKSIGLCCRRKTPGGHASNISITPENSFDVDENIDFNINSTTSGASFTSIENPVLTEEYLQARNAEIMAGPIELKTCMDLNEQGGVVTMVSPKLLKSKARNYLLHIKTMADLSKEGHGKTRVPVRKKGITSVLLTSFAKEPAKERVTYVQDTNSNKSNDYYIGCDWLHEISITVRATREVANLSNERLQRLAMLESNLLMRNLLEIASNNQKVLQQNLALDILNWIVSIRLARYRCSKNYFNKFSKVETINDMAATDVISQQSECVQIIEQSLGEIINKCILLNNRSVAHKCTKLITLTMIGAQYIMDQNQCYAFEMALKNTLQMSIPDMIKSNYAGGLRWFSLLISSTSTADSQGAISSSLINVLTDVLREISNRPSPLNSLLQARFGLYGMPFESELFDLELPSLSNKITNTQYASFLKPNNAQHSNLSDLKNFCSSEGSEMRVPMQLRRKGISNHFKGLLEVEPIHYVCCATSEATRIENMDSMSMQNSNIIEDILIESPGQNGVVKLGSMKMQMEPKKNETEIDKLEISIANEMKNVFVDKIFYSQIKKHAKYDKLKSLIKTDGSNVSNIKIYSNDEFNAPSTQECWGPSQISDYGIAETAGRGFEEPFENVKSCTSSSSVVSSKIKEFIDESNRDDNNPIYPWHKLLSTPAKQMIVVDRMHSGARRHVVLDFGYPILLTDFIIPSSADLASLTIDIWSFEEESDSVRLAVSQDIGVKSLILSDLQPPPVCRFLKITFTGRYGMSATRCKIPMGTFYGHVVFLEKETYTDPVMNLVKTKSSQIKTQLNVLNALYEDTHCRYCLSSSKLAELLKPLLRSENSNLSHMQSYLNRFKDMDEQNVEFNRINAVYEECIAFQNQLNVVKNVIKRLQLVATPEQPISAEVKLSSLSTDKLRVLSENLVETLLHFIVTYGIQNVSMLHSYFDLETCNLLFKTLVINGDSYIQLSTCSLLVRMCCFQPWWGEFFSNIFTSLFSSQNCEIFPQNRVFFLLTYLGRKSIATMGGTCRTTVFDAILKTIAQLLAPLSTSFDSRLGVWRNTDLILLSWLLLFLSVCLDDSSEKKENGNPRWDFMSHEADIVKARLSMNTNSSRNFSRSFKKRFLSSKQQSNSNIAEKFCMMSEQIASSQLEQAMKHHENSLKKLQTSIKLNTFNEYFHEYNKTVTKKNSENSTRSGGSSTSSKNYTSTAASSSSRVESTSFESVPGSPLDKGLKSIKTGNMLAVIRGLIGLLLNMDFTCNMDLFLLTCKIVARLVNSCRPSVQLSSIMTTNQLLQLIRIAVWENQQHPWTVHAITCLLQDILEADKNFKMMNNSNENVAMEIDPCDMDNDVDLDESSMQMPMMQHNHMPKDNLNYAEAVKYQLPSLMECDDTEMEDILDDILEQAKKITGPSKKDGAPTPPSRALTVLYRGKVSSTMDARLEYGLDANVEIWLRRQTMKSSLNLFVSLPRTGNNDTIHITNDIPVWSEDILSAWSNSEYQQNVDTNIMLMDVFENIFNDLHLEDSWLNLEQVLQLWLTLNGDINESGYNAGKQPKIPFGEKAVYGLLKALASHPNIKIRGWCLGFQCLIFACKPVDSDNEFMHMFGSLESYTKKIGTLIINNENFERMLLRFFSGSDKQCGAGASSYAGPTICRLMLELFSCLQTKCNGKEKLKEILLNVTLNLIRYDGAISKQQGPIDAQSQLIKELLKFQFVKADLGVAMSLVESVALLVHNHITNTEKINCHKSSESSGNTNNVFGSLFATVLGSDTQSKTVTDTTLLVNLLKLSSILIHTKIPPAGEENTASNDNAANMSSINECQTDEIKQQQQHTEPRPKSTPTFCDTVLQHYPTMNKLLAALSHCSNSSFAMLLISSMYTTINSETKNTLSDPQNVSDALFQLLIYLNKLAFEPVLIIKPLFDYLNYVSSVRLAMPKLQLSEPFLWFILKILETSTSVEIFCEMGGIKILAENLVRSNRSLINMQPNLVTMIMQHMSKSTHNVAAGAIKKTCSTKNEDGLINFAPFCSITSENPSAQPPDLLIQGPIASHRRARTPAWSYLFYPHESHVDLTMTLPTAVLLKEVQLQPHLSTLASCPSAVSIEITRDNNLGPIPITQPISTVGMTCIRLKLSQPEIATHIIIRLYRPKDSASIGLTQISILGSTIFSDIGSTTKLPSASSSCLLYSSRCV